MISSSLTFMYICHVRSSAITRLVAQSHRNPGFFERALISRYSPFSLCHLERHDSLFLPHLLSHKDQRLQSCANAFCRRVSWRSSDTRISASSSVHREGGIVTAMGANDNADIEPVCEYSGLYILLCVKAHLSCYPRGAPPTYH